MSTEHRQYSPESQLEVICQYAASNTEIVQDYSDQWQDYSDQWPGVG